MSELFGLLPWQMESILLEELLAAYYYLNARNQEQ